MQLIDLRYPQNLGIAVSGLGIDTCTATMLELLGPPGCPPDSMMGRGTALGEIPFGPAIIRESATLTIVRAENQNGQIAILFDAQGISPVEANLGVHRRAAAEPPPLRGGHQDRGAARRRACPKRRTSPWSPCGRRSVPPASRTTNRHTG